MRQDDAESCNFPLSKILCMILHHRASDRKGRTDEVGLRPFMSCPAGKTYSRSAQRKTKGEMHDGDTSSDAPVGFLPPPQGHFPERRRAFAPAAPHSPG